MPADNNSDKVESVNISSQLALKPVNMIAFALCSCKLVLTALKRLPIYNVVLPFHCITLAVATHLASGPQSAYALQHIVRLLHPLEAPHHNPSKHVPSQALEHSDASS